MAKQKRNGAKRPTMNDVARRAKVSPVSVSRVINNHPSIKESTKNRVLKAMHDLGYVPNAAAQSMRTNVTHTVGAIITDMANTANGRILRAAEAVINNAGKLMVATSSDFNIEREANLINFLQRHRVDGIILQTGHEESEALHQLIQNCTVPIVVLDRDLPFEIDSVCHEHYDAARKAFRYLISLGHTDIALLAAEQTTRPGHDRVKAYRDELAAANIKINERYIRAGSHLSEYGYSETITLMGSPNPPTALMAGGNHLLWGALQALRELNITIPKDLSLIGSDEAQLSSLFNPPMTVIDRDMEALGKKAAELLLARISASIPEQSRKLTLASDVILRGSCAPPHIA